MGSYRDLRIYQIAYELAIRVHRASLKLPQFELYEQGSQIRRSSKRIKDTIVEGFGRRRYKLEYIKYLIYAQASCDETISHSETIMELYPEFEEFEELNSEYISLGKQINSYIQFVEENWNDNKK